MPLEDLLPELLVLLGAVAVILLASFLDRSRQGWCAWVAAGSLLGAAVAAGAQFGTPARLSFSGVWAIDATTIWARLMILLASLLALLLSPEWFRRDRRHGEYYAVLLFASLGALCMAAAADTLQLVVGVLLSSICGYTLAAYHRAHTLSLEAGMKFFLVGAFANALLLVGVVWLFGLAGTTDYRGIAMVLAATEADSTWRVAATLLVIGLAFKLGAVPAHTWMPEVAQGAPAPAAAFLTVVPKLGAAIALARLGNLFAAELPGWQLLLMLLAAASMTLGNLAALRQTDLRRLLGWSSVSQSGYALVALALIGLSEQALPALLMFLAAYAAANLAAFAVVTELRGRTALDDYRGLAAAHPLIMACLTLALLSLIGIPPLAGFIGKLMLMLAAVDAGHAWLAILVVANTVVSLFYYLRVIGPAYFDSPPRPVVVLGRLAYLAMCLAAVAVVGLGLGAGVLLAGLSPQGLLP